MYPFQPPHESLESILLAHPSLKPDILFYTIKQKCEVYGIKQNVRFEGGIYMPTKYFPGFYEGSCINYSTGLGIWDALPDIKHIVNNGQ